MKQLTFEYKSNPIQSIFISGISPQNNEKA